MIHIRSQKGGTLYVFGKWLSELFKQRTLVIIIITMAILYAIKTYVIGEMNLFSSRTNFDAGTWQEILSALSGSMVGIVATTYSIKLLLLQLTSQQFSPRIIRVLLKANGRHLFFGLFISFIAVTYILKIHLGHLVLHPEEAMPANMPLFVQLFSLADILLIAIGLPFFIHDITDSINASSLTNLIYHRTYDELKKLYGKEKWVPNVDERPYQKPLPAPHAIIIQLRSHETGYLQYVNYKELSALRINTQLTSLLDRYQFKIKAVYQNKIVGNFLQMEGNLVDVILTTEEPNHLQKRIAEAQNELDNHRAIAKALERTFKVDKFRSTDQDINLGVRQLVDIALKAISPAVNDPTTALNAIDYLCTVIYHMNSLPFPSLYAQRLQRANIYVREFTFHDLVELAIRPIYHYGRTDASIVIRLLQNLGAVLKNTENPLHLMVLIKEVLIMKNDLAKMKQQKDEMVNEDYAKVQHIAEHFLAKAECVVDRILSYEALYVGFEDSLGYLKAFRNTRSLGN